jgi:hypothetical protein
MATPGSEAPGTILLPGKKIDCGSMLGEIVAQPLETLLLVHVQGSGQFKKDTHVTMNWDDGTVTAPAIVKDINTVWTEPKTKLEFVAVYVFRIPENKKPMTFDFGKRKLRCKIIANKKFMVLCG